MRKNYGKRLPWENHWEKTLEKDWLEKIKERKDVQLEKVKERKELVQL